MSVEKIVSYAILWIRVAFGAHALLSGLNYFIEVFPMPPVAVSPAGPFVDEMTRVGLYADIKVIEIVAGACLVTGWFVPLALVLELPVTISIFHLNVFIDGSPRPLVTGIRELVFNLVLMSAYAGYYLQMLRPRAPLRELWRLPLTPREKS
jgi:uncharacterized membrane protein YphA (DoxX/SURF4 family)